MMSTHCNNRWLFITSLIAACMLLAGVCVGQKQMSDAPKLTLTVVGVTGGAPGAPLTNLKPITIQLALESAKLEPASLAMHEDGSPISGKGAGVRLTALQINGTVRTPVAVRVESVGAQKRGHQNSQIYQLQIPVDEKSKNAAIEKYVARVLEEAQKGGDKSQAELAKTDGFRTLVRAQGQQLFSENRTGTFELHAELTVPAAAGGHGEPSRIAASPALMVIKFDGNFFDQPNFHGKQ